MLPVAPTLPRAPPTQAIEHHLKEETIFLTRYDQIYRRIGSAFDVANSDLSRLVMFCLDQPHIVAVVSGATLTRPFSYSQASSTFRTVGAYAAATRRIARWCQALR